MYFLNSNSDFWRQKAIEFLMENGPVIRVSKKIYNIKKNKKIVLIVGNHDAELIFPSMQKYLLSKISPEYHSRFLILLNEEVEYRPHPKVCIKHGHEYEFAHNFSSTKNFVFIPILQ